MIELPEDIIKMVYIDFLKRNFSVKIEKGDLTIITNKVRYTATGNPNFPWITETL